MQSAFAYAVTELTREHPGRQPVQIDLALAPLDLRPVAAAVPPAPPPPPAVPPPPAAPPPATTPCRQLLVLACRS